VDGSSDSLLGREYPAERFRLWRAASDNKWFTRVIVAAAVIDALALLNLRYPKVTPAKRDELAAAKDALLGS